MITDGQISSLENDIRRLEDELSAKRRELQDLQSRQRNEQEREKRDSAQKILDDKREHKS